MDTSIYKRVVHPGHYTRPLLKCNRICFDGSSMDNEYQGAELDITINAEAIQATNGAIQEEWGVSWPTVVPFNEEEPVEEKLTEADVLDIIEEEVASEDHTGEIISQVCFDGPNMDNDYPGSHFTLTVNSEAIQVTNGAALDEWGVYPPNI